jgi:hypothetical protein
LDWRIQDEEIERNMGKAPKKAPRQFVSGSVTVIDVIERTILLEML